jgi:Flp pilus assembly protein TadD
LIEDAKSDLTMAARSEPDNAAALSALGYVYLLEGNLNRAQGYYEKALEVDPKSIEALNNLATVLAERHKYQSAVSIWERALAIEPTNQDIKDNMSEARQKMGGPGEP